MLISCLPQEPQNYYKQYRLKSAHRHLAQKLLYSFLLRAIHYSTHCIANYF